MWTAKTKERIRKLKETDGSKYIYQNKLDKACFMEILKIYTKEQLLIKYYVIKHLILLKMQNMMDINVDLPQWFIIFGETRKNEIISNKVLPEELHKPIIRKMEKRKVHSPFIDNIWRADMHL